MLLTQTTRWIRDPGWAASNDLYIHPLDYFQYYSTCTYSISPCMYLFSYWTTHPSLYLLISLCRYLSICLSILCTSVAGVRRVAAVVYFRGCSRLGHGTVDGRGKYWTLACCIVFLSVCCFVFCINLWFVSFLRLFLSTCLSVCCQSVSLSLIHKIDDYTY